VATSGIETNPAPRCFRVDDRGGVTVVTVAGAGALGAALREAVADEALAAARSILDRDDKER
jgi:hypothetical protein